MVLLNGRHLLLVFVAVWCWGAGVATRGSQGLVDAYRLRGCVSRACLPSAVFSLTTDPPLEQGTCIDMHVIE